MQRPFLFQDMQYKDIENLIFDYFVLYKNIGFYKKLALLNQEWYLYITKFLLVEFYVFFKIHKNEDYYNKIHYSLITNDIDIIQYLFYNWSESIKSENLYYICFTSYLKTIANKYHGKKDIEILLFLWNQLVQKCTSRTIIYTKLFINMNYLNKNTNYPGDIVFLLEKMSKI